ncbi:MAG TPA: glycosyltransferase 87 family protein [Verrucomicrobiales bacterium]|nr:glycosyltransferase 87 family protein [Verrucomicrobiales bacterium]
MMVAAQVSFPKAGPRRGGRAILSALLPVLALGGWAFLARLSHAPPASMAVWLLVILALQWTFALWVWRNAGRRYALVWVICGVAFRVAGLFADPILEDDHYRFLWDGRSFAVSGNPYATAPADHFQDEDLPDSFAAILDHINYPGLPTVYGPVVQTGFLSSYLLAPARIWPWKLLLLAADALLLAALWKLGSSNGSGFRAALFAAWCPLSVFETSFNAHPEALAVCLLAWALLAGQGRRPVLTGILCAAAAAARLPALLSAPFLLWRKPLSAPTAFAVTLLACYLPFLIQGSWADLTGLQIFAREWEFNSSIYAVIAWALSPQAARSLCSALLLAGAVVLFLLHQRFPGRLPLPTALAFLYGLLFLLSPVFNPWYALWLLPFVALGPSSTGITLLAAVSLSYLTRQNLGDAVLHGFEHPPWLRPLEFGLVAAALVADLFRIPSASRPDPNPPPA